MNVRRFALFIALVCLSTASAVVGTYATAGLLAFDTGGNGSPPCYAEKCCYICDRDGLGGSAICKQVEWFSDYGVDFDMHCNEASYAEGSGGKYWLTMMACGTSGECFSGGGGGGQGKSGNSSTPSNTTCGDGQDNEGDGFIDWDDPDCMGGWPTGENNFNGSSSSSPSSTCGDGIDNEGDGFIDWDDPDCMGGWPTGENNFNGWSSSSLPPTCNDEQDNDGDGFIDWNDPDCPQMGGSAGGEIHDNRNNGSGGGTGGSRGQGGRGAGGRSSSGVSTCFDGQDNDTDGFADGNDPDCYTNGRGQEGNSTDAADLMVNIFGPEKLEQGEVVSYAVVVENRGTAFANGIDAYATLANNVTYIGDGNIPCNRNGNTFHCTFTLQPSENRRILFQLLVNDQQLQTDCGKSISAIEVSTFTTTKENNRANNAAAAASPLQCRQSTQQSSSQQGVRSQNNEQQRIEELQQHLQMQQLQNAVQNPPLAPPQPDLGCFTVNGLWTSERTLCDENQGKHVQEQTEQSPPSPAPSDRTVEQMQKVLHRRFMPTEKHQMLLNTIYESRDKLLYIQEQFNLQEKDRQFVQYNINWLNGQTSFFTSQNYTQQNMNVLMESIHHIASETERMLHPAEQPGPDIATIISQTWNLLQKTYNVFQVLFREQIPVNPSLIAEFQRANTLLVDVQSRCLADASSCGDLSEVLTVIEPLLKELNAIVESSNNPAIAEEVSRIFAQ